MSRSVCSSGTDRRDSVLLVEDDPCDARLAREAFREADSTLALAVVESGEEALEYLHRRGEYADAPTPSFVLLDHNLPAKSGADVLRELKNDPTLRRIPITVFTTSDARDDVVQMYDLHANAYITKPDTIAQYVSIVDHLESFWLSVVTLPPIDRHD